MQNKFNKKAAIFMIFLLFIMVALVPVVNSSYAVTLKSKTQNDGDITYDVYFGTTSPPAKVVSNQTETLYNPGTLEHNTTYYWQIIAWDDQGESAEGPIWSFTTGANQIPVAIIIAPASGNKKVDIPFDGSSSYDPDGYIVEYLWDFGDGETGNGSIVDHQFISSGMYIVTLQVEDDDGDVGQNIHQITINNQAPVASIVVDHQYIEPGDTVTFDGTASYDPDGDSLTYEWKLDDGAVIGTEAVIAYMFTEPGSFQVILTVFDDDPVNPLSDSTIVMIYVNAPPVADFTYDPQTIWIGDTVEFDGSSSYDPDGEIVNYSWDFGDEESGYGMIVYHMFMYDGYFTVTLTVTDDMGSTGSHSEEIYVEGVFKNSNILISYKRDITTCGTENIIKSESSNYPPKTPSNPYPEDGAINVPIDVVLSWTGCEDLPPDTPIIIGETNGKAGEEYEYCIDPVVDPDGDRVWVFWDWGDGTDSGWLGPYESGEQACANHSWDEEEDYTIKARLKDDYGALSDWGYLDVTMPRAKILHNVFLQWLFEKFPNAFPILQYIFGLYVQ